MRTNSLSKVGTVLSPEGTAGANVLGSEAVRCVPSRGDRVGGESQERRWERAPEVGQEKVSNSTQGEKDNTGPRQEMTTWHFTKIPLAPL